MRNSISEKNSEIFFGDHLLDQFQIGPKYIPGLKRNIEEIEKLNFNELKRDVIGNIYNNIIDRVEQNFTVSL